MLRLRPTGRSSRLTTSFLVAVPLMSLAAFSDTTKIEIIPITVTSDATAPADRNPYSWWDADWVTRVPMSVGIPSHTFDPPRGPLKNENATDRIAFARHCLWAIGENDREAFGSICKTEGAWEDTLHNLRNRYRILSPEAPGDLRLFKLYHGGITSYAIWGMPGGEELFHFDVIQSKDGLLVPAMLSRRSRGPYFSILETSLGFYFGDESPELLPEHMGNKTLQLPDMGGTPGISIGFSGRTMPEGDRRLNRDGVPIPSKNPPGESDPMSLKAVEFFRNCLKVHFSIPKEEGSLDSPETQDFLRRLSPSSAQRIRPHLEDKDSFEEVMSFIQESYTDVYVAYVIEADPFFYIFWTVAGLQEGGEFEDFWDEVRGFIPTTIYWDGNRFRWADHMTFAVNWRKNLYVPMDLFTSDEWNSVFVPFVKGALGIEARD